MMLSVSGEEQMGTTLYVYVQQRDKRLDAGFFRSFMVRFRYTSVVSERQKVATLVIKYKKCLPALGTL